MNFDLASAGSLLLHGTHAGPRVNFNLTGAGSRLTVAGSLALLSGSTLGAGTGTRIDISGDFSFAQSVESQMNLDLATLGFSGGGAHLLEIGGSAMACQPPQRRCWAISASANGWSARPMPRPPRCDGSMR